MCVELKVVDISQGPVSTRQGWKPGLFTTCGGPGAAAQTLLSMQVTIVCCLWRCAQRVISHSLEVFHRRNTYRVKCSVCRRGYQIKYIEVAK